MKRLVLLVSGYLITLSTLCACGSDDDGGGAAADGGSGGSSLTASASAACNKKFEAGCPQDDGCIASHQSDYAIYEFFSCDEQFRTYLDCLGTNTWTCETISGGYSWNEPDACDPLRSQISDCRGDFAYIGGTDTCQTSYILDGQALGAECEAGLSCTCTIGPKQSTTFQTTSCTQLTLLKAVAEYCK